MGDFGLVLWIGVVVCGAMGAVIFLICQYAHLCVRHLHPKLPVYVSGKHQWVCMLCAGSSHAWDRHDRIDPRSSLVDIPEDRTERRF